MQTYFVLINEELYKYEAEDEKDLEKKLEELFNPCDRIFYTHEDNFKSYAVNNKR